MNADALRLVLNNLSGALVYTEPSVTETNRKLWNQYAKNWRKGESSNSNQDSNESWLAVMADNVGRNLENDINVLGEECTDTHR